MRKQEANLKWRTFCKITFKLSRSWKTVDWRTEHRDSWKHHIFPQLFRFHWKHSWRAAFFLSSVIWTLWGFLFWTTLHDDVRYGLRAFWEDVGRERDLGKWLSPQERSASVGHLGSLGRQRVLKGLWLCWEKSQKPWGWMEDGSCDSISPTESQVPGPLGELSRLLPDYLTSIYWHCPRC